MMDLMPDPACEEGGYDRVRLRNRAERLVEKAARTDHFAPADRIQHDVNAIGPRPPENARGAVPISRLAQRVLDQRGEHRAAVVTFRCVRVRAALDGWHPRGQLDEGRRMLQSLAPRPRCHGAPQQPTQLLDVELLLLEQAEPPLAGLAPVSHTAPIESGEPAPLPAAPLAAPPPLALRARW